MKRLKSSLASGLMIAAGVAKLGLGAVLAVAALVIGVVIAGAARLEMGVQASWPQAGKPVSANAASPM